MNKTSKPSHRGEVVIGRAFRRSLIVIALIILVVAASFFLMRDKKQQEVVPEAEVSGPVSLEGRQIKTPPKVGFTDITDEAGIDFVHINGAYGDKLLPEAVNGGVAFFDYDNDSDPDLLLINSTAWEREGSNPQEASPSLALYQNNGKGEFTNVTSESGLELNLYGMGVAVGDIDNDGWTDVFVTAVGENHLFHNEGGSFKEITGQAGVAGLPEDWSTSAAFVDYDNDSDLDLFVVNYVKWSRTIDLAIDFRLAGLGRSYGAPRHFVGINDYLYRNDGADKFTNVSSEAGIHVINPGSGQAEGKGLGIMPVDYDHDGWIDLIVANDTTRNFLFHNLGNGRFEEVGALEGIAYDRNGKATGAMGIDAAYFRNDSDLAVAIGNFANEMSSLLVTAEGQPPFIDEAILEGFGSATRLALTFGLFFFDYDLDGWSDLLQANGHMEGEINKVQPSQQYAQPAQLFWNCGNQCSERLVEVKDKGGLAQPLVGRGASYADIDGDGDLDVIITQTGRRAVLFRNDQQLGHHWLRIKLVGKAVNRNAIGAWLELTTNGVTQRRQVMPSRSFMSQVELPVTFGLGESTKVDKLRVIWPDGRSQDVDVNSIDTQLVIAQTI